MLKSFVRRIRILLFILTGLYPLIIINFSCSVSGKWANEISWSEIDFEHLPSSKEYPDAEAIVLLDEGLVEIQFISDHSFSTYERHNITKIFNVRGHHFANVVIPYGSKTVVDEIEARTIAPDGSITVLDPETIFDVNLYPNFVFYSDQRAKIFTLPSIEDNCIIEYRYSMTIHSQTYGNFWRFQTFIPVNITRFTLIKPAEWELDYRLYDIKIDPVTRPLSNGTKESLVWEVRNLEPIKKEPAMPPTNDLGARLALRPVGINSWQDISRWYQDIVEPQLDINAEIEQTVQRITKGVKTNEEKLKRIFEWTRDQIRYIAVSIGMGGFQPHAVTEIMRNKYGDCKDMTTLLCAMASCAGIDVYQALISTRLNGIADTTLPAAVHFNHVIAFAPDFGENGIWMDATEKTAPFSRLPWYDQGVPTLIVTPEGTGKIIVTPKTDSRINHSEMIWEIELSNKGTALIDGRITAYGNVANEMREQFYLASNKDIEDWLQLFLAARVAGSQLTDFEISGMQPVADPLIINFKSESKRFARMLGQDLIILPGDITRFNLADYFKTGHRMQDIHLQFLSSRNVQINIEIPDGMTVNKSTQADSLISEFGKYRRFIKKSESHISLQYEYQIDREIIPSSKYREFQKFLDTIDEYDFHQIVIESNKDQIKPEYLKSL